MTLLSRACVSLISISLKLCTVYEIFSVKEWRDLETGGRGRSRSLKMAPFDNHIRLSVVSIAVCCTVFNLFDVE